MEATNSAVMSAQLWSTYTSEQLDMIHCADGISIVLLTR
jgi:hypothetical protein